MKLMFKTLIVSAMMVATGCTSLTWQAGTAEGRPSKVTGKKYYIDEIYFIPSSGAKLADSYGEQMAYDEIMFIGVKPLWAIDIEKVKKGLVEAMPESFSTNENAERISIVVQSKNYVQAPYKTYDENPLGCMLTLGQFPNIITSDCSYKIFLLNNGKKSELSSELRIRRKSFTSILPSNLLFLTWIAPAKDDNFSETVRMYEGDTHAAKQEEINKARYRAFGNAILRAMEINTPQD